MCHVQVAKETDLSFLFFSGPLRVTRHIQFQRICSALYVQMAHSASVKKQDDGKWKVDTSYIGHRTGDPANLTRPLGTDLTFTWFF